MFIKTGAMPCTRTLLMDQPLEEGTISRFLTMQKRQMVTQTLATHTSPLRATATETPIPNTYWLAAITLNPQKLKFIILFD